MWGPTQAYRTKIYDSVKNIIHPGWRPPPDFESTKPRGKSGTTAVMDKVKELWTKLKNDVIKQHNEGLSDRVIDKWLIYSYQGQEV